MFGISFEHILIVGVILIIVGPRRLPELGNTMGKAIKNFKDSFSGIEEANFKRLTPDTVTPVTPAQAPAQAVAPVASSASVAPTASSDKS
jgi:sec-independent protein translocase protein TatA